MHVLPNQYLLYRGDIKRYFPKNDLMEKSTANKIGGSLYVAYHHRAARLAKFETKTSETNKHNKQFPIYRGTDNPDVDDFAMVSLRVNLFCYPNLKNYWLKA